jgi:hypothetical protein
MAARINKRCKFPEMDMARRSAIGVALAAGMAVFPD